MAMPERIFEGATLKFRACCSPDTTHALREAVEWVWATAQREASASASTHQRALEALETIASLHIPDMPAHFGGDELQWAQRHVVSLRRIAAEALTRIKEATDAGT